jgi:hypothetical protein
MPYAIKGATEIYKKIVWRNKKEQKEKSSVRIVGVRYEIQSENIPEYKSIALPLDQPVQ